MVQATDSGSFSLDNKWYAFLFILVNTFCCNLKLILYSISLTHSFIHSYLIDKTIKLWKVNEKSIYNVVDNNSIHFKTKLCDAHSLTAFSPSPQMLDTDYFSRMPQAHSVSSPSLMLPKVVVQEEIMFAIPKKIYASAHAYHINSISINSDGETFLSSDDLRIHLWSLNNEQQSFNMVDLKPPNMEDLNEVITTAEFHPSNCYQFIYGTSKGMVKLCDLRRSAICDQCDKGRCSKGRFMHVPFSYAPISSPPLPSPRMSI